jgi:hypothetical protein
MRLKEQARGRWARTRDKILARARGRVALAALAFFFCAAASGVPLFAPAQAKTRARQATAQQTAARQAALTPEERAAIGRVSADDLRTYLKFISSDELEGRNTPSRGLDTAADYIAAQFRGAGLEPAGDDGYFQTANWATVARDASSFHMKLDAPPHAVEVDRSKMSLASSLSGFTLWGADGPLALTNAGVVYVDVKDPAALAALTREQVEGKVVLTELPDLRREDRSRVLQAYQGLHAALDRLAELKAALVVSVDRSGATLATPAPRLVDPESAGQQRNRMMTPPAIPVVTVGDPSFVAQFDALRQSQTADAKATVSVSLGPPVQTPVKVRNVAGILRGSDPQLKDTYVLVTAHYDHLGVREGCDRQKEDCIYNGANDDGSGTVSVVELASALSTLKARPKRSVLFMTFFGEEKGLLGSRYYGRHPLVPLAQTVAQLNLEQVGRTDDSEGPQVGTVAVTGFDYTDVGTTLSAAGELEGVKVYKHPRNSDAYFGRSDNQALADVGVPAHTLSVAYEFPDYHGVGDEWQKVDYDNMAKVDRAVAAALLLIADDPREPKWDESNPKTARYVEAWKNLHGK